MIYVTKFDGRKQLFNKQKIMRTCIRMHATPKIAKAVADKIEAHAYNGISTKKIMQMIFAYMRKHRPEVKHMTDLRTAISMLRPKPDFELFIAQLLRAYDYKVKSNCMVLGKCVEHEIDAIAEKYVEKNAEKGKGTNKDVFYVEVKHHYKPHTYTGLDVFLEARATFEDLIDGYKIGANKIKFNKAMVICNTKISEHARRYSKCRKIMHIGWKAPVERGLETLIEEKQLHPITLLRGIDPADEIKLGDAGIVILKQLIELSLDELWKKTKIPKKTLKEFKFKAQKILSA